MRLAMLAATYATSLGRGQAFALAALRQAYAGGRDLADHDTLILAGAACEIHPRAILAALDSAAVASELDRTSAAARSAGVTATPAVTSQGEVLTDLAAARAAAASVITD